MTYDSTKKKKQVHLLMASLHFNGATFELLLTDRTRNKYLDYSILIKITNMYE